MNRSNSSLNLIQKACICLAAFLFLLIYTTDNVASDTLNCDNRYLTLVNPVRDRQLWKDKSLAPIEKQYKLIKENGFSATWLIQYDVLKDTELMGFIKGFNDNQEVGVFLEISESLAYDSKVIYPHARPWFDPGVLFLSGYSRSERLRLIDTLFSNFKDLLGYYPKSLGAWWIDSYSLNYIEEKYGISSVLIVADQLTTDNYGVWGQWWGVPYYPSKFNVLKPAADEGERSDFVVIQWAQRDLTRAYGEGPSYSNYSLQANDYTERGLDTEYFKSLVQTYLDCALPLGQITVGLETGIEGFTHIDEYERQLEYLGGINNLEPVTMGRFFELFKKTHSSNPQSLVFGDGISSWFLTTRQRRNDYLKDEVDYSSVGVFSDHFVADRESFLNRRLTDEDMGVDERESLELFYLPLFVFLIYALSKGLFRVWFLAAAFIIAAFGLLLRSGYQYGWKVFYGPVVFDLELTNLILVTFTFVAFFTVWEYFSISKRINIGFFYLLLPLSFGIDTLVRLVRYTNIENKHYLGVVFDTFNFYGFTFFEFGFVALKLPHVVAGALLKFNMEKIWESTALSIFVYPLVHIVLASILAVIMNKMKPRVRYILILIFFIAFIGHIYYIFSADPRVVLGY